MNQSLENLKEVTPMSSQRRHAPRGLSLAQRLLFHTDKAESLGGCWRWTGSIDSGGYGRIAVGKTCKYVHRVSFEIFVGPIQSGLQIDHLCRVRCCWNPQHLEAVTAALNMRRSNATGAVALRRDTCLRGHAYRKYGVTRHQRRVCRLCLVVYSRVYSKLTREEVAKCQAKGVPAVDLADVFAHPANYPLARVQEAIMTCRTDP